MIHNTLVSVTIAVIPTFQVSVVLCVVYKYIIELCFVFISNVKLDMFYNIHSMLKISCMIFKKMACYC